MSLISRRCVSGIACLLMFCVSSASAAEPGWQAGFSRTVITPEGPLWMAGYAGRTAPAEGKVHDLYARVAALVDPTGKKLLFISTDLITVPGKMAHVVSQAVAEKYQIPREQMMFTCSHTHCGPVLDDHLRPMHFMPDDELKKVEGYQPYLNGKLLAGIEAALKDVQPAEVAWGIGNARFASFRRPPIGTGPYDHDVPVLRVLSPEDHKLRGVVFGYACHNTTMGFQLFCGDYAGFAQLDLEARHPGAVALFHLGCGADQNPLPRRKLELCEKYGKQLADAVDRVVATPMHAIAGPANCQLKRIDLPLDHVPTRPELEAKQKTGNKYEQGLATRLLAKLDQGEKISDTYPYPVEVWQLGDSLNWVALGGEITVEYSLRIKEQLGGDHTWVTGYANDVMAYIPSEKILAEGGYEGESSQTYYQFFTKWAPGIEKRILSTVFELAEKK